MNEGRTHFPWATTADSSRRAPARTQVYADRRPDRVALWAFFLALFAIIVAAGTAHASGGGVSAGSSGGSQGTSQSSSSQSAGAGKHWRRGPATYYNMTGRTACGTQLTSNTIGVANNTLPCGTKVSFRYKGHIVRAKVIDRGGFGCAPYFDLTYGLKQKLGFPGSGKVKYSVAGDKAAC
jgi:hypothetical protein